MKRIFDLVAGMSALIVLIVPIMIVAIVIKLTTKGTVFYWSDRVGKWNVNFKMPKFRTMLMETPDVATNLMTDPGVFLTPIGKFLRRTSIDEFPQIWSILKGDMSFVGPRPALYNQDDLIVMRTEKGVDQLLPGLTGWAQVNGRDELSISEKVALDIEYIERKSFIFDMQILLLTFIKIIKGEDISH